MRTGGCGFWTGFGHDQIGSKSTNSPWNSASSWVQISFMARMRSRMSEKRRFGSVPWLRISSRFQPPPTPNSKRPPDRKSSEATSLAVVIGSRSTTRQMPVPSRSFVVACATVASATNGSCVCQYFSGSSPPRGFGVSRATGMCVCSAKSSVSKPASSAARPSSAGAIEKSVGKVIRPNLTACSLRHGSSNPGPQSVHSQSELFLRRSSTSRSASGWRPPTKTQATYSSKWAWARTPGPR